MLLNISNDILVIALESKLCPQGERENKFWPHRRNRSPLLYKLSYKVRWELVVGSKLRSQLAANEHASVYLLVCLSVCLSICLSVCLSSRCLAVSLLVSSYNNWISVVKLPSHRLVGFPACLFVLLSPDILLANFLARLPEVFIVITKWGIYSPKCRRPKSRSSGYCAS